MLMPFRRLTPSEREVLRLCDTVEAILIDGAVFTGAITSAKVDTLAIADIGKVARDDIDEWLDSPEIESLPELKVRDGLTIRDAALITRFRAWRNRRSFTAPG